METSVLLLNAVPISHAVTEKNNRFGLMFVRSSSALSVHLQSKRHIVQPDTAFCWCPWCFPSRRTRYSTRDTAADLYCNMPFVVDARGSTSFLQYTCGKDYAHTYPAPLGMHEWSYWRHITLAAQRNLVIEL